MMIQKTIEALSILFPDDTSTTQPEAEVTSNEEGDEKDAAPEPRSNGILERDYAVHGYHVDVQLSPDQLVQAVEIIDSLEYFLESITGVDWIKENQMEIIYDFSRYDFDLCRVVLRTRVDRESPVVPTITGVYAGANWHERETHEFFGIRFDGHPHLVPLLLPEDADFHPLLKDFKA